MDKPDKEDQLISVMLEETFDSMNAEGVSKDRKELLKHFVEASSKSPESTLQDDEFLYNFLNRQNLFFLSGSYIHQTHCLRFSFGHATYDIPENMKSLSNFSDDVKSGENNIILLNDDCDNDHLGSVFSTFCGYDADLIFVNTKFGIYLILPPKNDDAVYGWLSNYLGIKENKTILKAA